MNQYNRVVFITESGTGRAPMAEEIMKSLELNREIEVCSRGRVVLFPEPINQKTELILDLKGKNKKEHMSTPLSEEDLTEDTLIITMENSQKEKIKAQFDATDNVFTICELAGEEGEVKSPYGEPLAVYDDCYNLLQRLIVKIVEKLNEEDVRDDSTGQ